MLERPSVSNNLDRPAALFAQALVLLLAGIGPPLLFTIPAPSLALIATHYGAGITGTTIAQLVMTLPSLGIIVGGILSGILLRRVPADRFLIFATLAFGLLGSAPIVIDQPVLVLATRLGAGAAAAGAAVATTQLITIFYDALRRERMVSYLAAVGAASGVVALLAAGTLSAWFGWRASFALYMVGFLIAGIARTVLPHVPLETTRSGDRISNQILRSLLPTYCWVVAIFALTFLAGTQTSFLLSGRGIVSPATQSVIIVCGAAANIVGGLGYPVLLRSTGRKWSFCALLLLLGIGTVLLGASPLAATSALGCTLMGLGGGMASPHFINLIIDKAADTAGEAVALCYSAIFIGEFVCPLLMLPFRIWANLETGFILLGAVCIAVAAILSLNMSRMRLGRN